jgi:hypothetical protein
MAHDQQSIEQPERDRRHHEKVYRSDTISMVAKERLPSLRGRAPPPGHILGDAGLADIDAELEKLTMDSRCSPQRIGDAHLADQPANLQRHLWSTAAASRSPAPIQPETGAVPADHGIGSDNGKCLTHLGKQPADTSQYQPVNRRKSKSLGIGTPQHIDLLPQHQNLCLERCARPQQIDHRPKDQFAQIQHRAAASPDSQSTASGFDLR